MTLGNKDAFVFCIIRSDLRNRFFMLHVRRVRKGRKHNILPNFPQQELLPPSEGVRSEPGGGGGGRDGGLKESLKEILF